MTFVAPTNLVALTVWLTLTVRNTSGTERQSTISCAMSTYLINLMDVNHYCPKE